MTLIFAHRGASAAHTENTLEAFRGAVEMGADGIELDVRPTLDNAVVVHHDAALADGRVIVETLAADLPDHVPSLDAALAAAGDLVVNVEIKHDEREPDFDPGRGFAEVVLARLTGVDPSRLLISSFDAEMMGRVRELAPALPSAQLLMMASPEAADLAARAGHVALHPMAGMFDAGLVDHCHGLGLAVNTWTVDDPDQMKALAEMGVDAIVTNKPDLARQTLG
jgi:glycerophosphoryl diester phosphodiesterase